MTVADAGRHERPEGGSDRGAQHVPGRTCVGCRQPGDKHDMVRIIRGPDGTLAADPAGRSFGRGAWLHPTPPCIEGAAKKGLSKSFRAAVHVRPEELTQLIRSAADRRVAALLGSARGAGALTAGGEAVGRALDDGSADLVVVACDARSAAGADRIRAAVANGRALAWGTKATLGEITGRSETGVAAVSGAGIAAALRRAIALSQIPSNPSPERPQGVER